jgi:hypothetical protein
VALGSLARIIRAPTGRRRALLGSERLRFRLVGLIAVHLARRFAFPRPLADRGGKLLGEVRPALRRGSPAGRCRRFVWRAAIASARHGGSSSHGATSSATLRAFGRGPGPNRPRAARSAPAGRPRS